MRRRVRNVRSPVQRVVAVAFLVAGCSLFGMTTGAHAETAQETELHDILAEFLAENEVAPGVIAHVECPSLDLKWSGTAGTVAHGLTEPLTARHTFRIASNTKTYTAAAVLRLVEQGRLNLDDSLAMHLPADQRDLLGSDGYDLDAITIRQVLSHTSGLCEHAGDPRYAEAILADPQHHWTAAEQIRACVAWCDPVGVPGELYSYSDTGYILLGGIIARLTDSNLGVAVRGLLDYEALGLEVTWWEYLEEQPAAAGPRAHQYYGEYDTTEWHGSFDLYGGGGIVTDAPELALFLRKLLRGEVLQLEATLAAMTGDGTPPYRLGLMCVELAGHLAWGHQGFWNTFAFHVPSLDLTLSGAILNHHAGNGRELAQRMVAWVATEKARPR